MTVKFTLLGTRGVQKVVVVDDSDAWLLRDFKWRVNTAGYAYRAECSRGNKKWLYLHRVLMNARPDQEVDHANRDKLDNRRGNLRFCSRGENMRNVPRPAHNQCGLKGVSYDGRRPRSKPWFARIQLDKKQRHLGNFASAEEAHAAYRMAAARLHGAFACLE